jgi:hypothetical protein
MARGEWCAGSPARKEPGRVLLVAHNRVLSVLLSELENEAVQRCGQLQRDPLEFDRDALVVLDHMVGDQVADGGGLLGVKQHHQPSDPVFEVDGVVVQQAAGDGPPFIGIEGRLANDLRARSSISRGSTGLSMPRPRLSRYSSRSGPGSWLPSALKQWTQTCGPFRTRHRLTA